MQKLILGTVQFGLDYGINNTLGKPNKVKVKEILDYAFENEITILDTAEAYGNAHDVIAEYHRSSSNRFSIISKYKEDAIGLDKNIINRVKNHLTLFDIKQLEAYFFHDFDEFVKFAGDNEEQLTSLIQKGFVKKIGVSVYSNEQLKELLNYNYVTIVQLPFNLFDNQFQRASLLEKFHEKGIEIHTRSTFLQGLFFKELDNWPSNLKELEKHIFFIKNLCQKNGIKIEELALKYCLSKSYIDKVLIGVDSKEQLEANLNSVINSIPKTILKSVDAIEVEDIELLNPSNW